MPMLPSISLAEHRGAAQSLRRRGVAWLLLAGLLSLASAGVGAAPVPPMVFKRLGQEQGLSQASVNQSLQDSRGFLWFATENGLNRWDGTAMRQYLRDPGTPGALADDFIYALAEDRGGDLWLATNGGGLIRWRRATDRFEEVPLATDPELVKARQLVRSVHIRPDGEIWAGTRGGGVVVLAPDGHVLREYRHGVADPGSLASDAVTVIASGADGSLWIGTDRGLDRLRPGATTFEHHAADPADKARLADAEVQSVLEDREGTLWVGTFAGGLHRLAPGSRRFERFQADAADEHALSGNQVRAIFEDTSSRLWVATERGLDLMDRATGRFRHARHDPADPYSLSGENVISITQDRSGLLWFGTLATGVNGWNPRSWSLGLTALKALAGSNITSFAQDATGKGVWVGTFDQGLLRLGGIDGMEVSHFGKAMGLPELSGGQVMSLLVSTTGELWAGTLGSGLNRYDPRSGLLTVYRFDPANPASLGDDGIMSLHQASDGAIWVGTFGGGVARIDPRSGAVRRYGGPGNATGGDPLVGARATAMAEAGKGGMWIGTDGAGLLLLDVATGSARKFGQAADGRSLLGADTVYALHRDARDTLWVGTAGGGLARLEKASAAVAPGAFQRLAIKDGLSSNVIYGIRPGADGKLWLSSNHGLMQLDPTTLAIREFHRSHGLQGEEFNFGAHFAAADGRLFFGGPGGFNAFDPRKVEANAVPPQLAITGFERFNQAVKLAVPVSQLTELGLQHDDDVISIEFAALDFAAPEKNRYSFRLEGFDRGWSTPGPLHRATYTDLSAGDYTLRVRAANSDGVWTEQALTLKLHVAAAPWATWWALLGYAAALVATGWALLRWRLRKMEKDARYRQLAYYDQITGLPNRQLFQQRATAALARAAARGETLAVLCVQVGGLRSASRSLGHQAVEQVLRSFATRLNHLVHGGGDAIEQSDLAWLGGETFITYFHSADAVGDAESVVHRLIAEASGPGAEAGAGPAVGISLYPQHGASVDELITYADTAAAQAMIERRRGVVHYEKAMTARARDRLALEADLRAALAEGSLELHFQPKYDGARRITGSEALLRWKHAVRGWVSPAQFIPLAEESTLIESLDDFVVNRACATLRELAQRGEPLLPIAINISAGDLATGRIVGVLTKAVREHGVPPELLEIEITESALLKEVDKAAAALALLKAAGHKLVLDDFGTGYSSLTHLQHFPIDCVKIDRSFVIAGERVDGASVCRGIVALAKSLRLKTVAEGVETEAQRDTMLMLGCDELQGWLFSKALPVEDYARLLRQNAVVPPANAPPANGAMASRQPLAA